MCDRVLVGGSPTRPCPTCCSNWRPAKGGRISPALPRQPQDDVGVALAGPPGHLLLRLSPLAGGRAFGSGVGFEAASNRASAARSGSRRGAWGNLSSSTAKPDCRRYRGELVVGEVNCRHGLIIMIGADIMPFGAWA